MVLNLLSNAVKFQAKGTIKVFASVQRKELRAKSVLKLVVSVIDEGVGLSAEDAKHVFDPFYKNMQHRNLNPKGVGVGLSICKQICQQLNGDIWVSQNPKGGCEFSFTMEVFDDNNVDEGQER